MAEFDRGIVSKEQEIIVKHILYTDGTINTVAMGELVRCKDCIHWGKSPVSTVLPQYHKCGMATYKSTKGDDFCSDGNDGEQ